MRVIVLAWSETRNPPDEVIIQWKYTSIHILGTKEAWSRFIVFGACPYRQALASSHLSWHAPRKDAAAPTSTSLSLRAPGFYGADARCVWFGYER